MTAFYIFLIIGLLVVVMVWYDQVKHHSSHEDVQRELAAKFSGYEPIEEPEHEGEAFSIAGINHRKGIAAYVGDLDCALVPEPTNEFDPNAIKVVAEDGHHLGYIPTDMTDRVRWLTAKEFPYRCEAHIKQCVDEDDGHTFFVGTVWVRILK